MFGFDARLTVAGLALAGEYVHVDEEEGAGGKQTGAGRLPDRVRSSTRTGSGPRPPTR